MRYQATRDPRKLLPHKDSKGRLYPYNMTRERCACGAYLDDDPHWSRRHGVCAKCEHEADRLTYRYQPGMLTRLWGDHFHPEPQRPAQARDHWRVKRVKKPRVVRRGPRR